ncbi:hypothetical protein [Kutzneria kofuensis]|uniref:Uncharacterized protein n=1 Tax=Kutzneria kofuensis TaxID=103725 RepID=A0A7W9KKR6_9PSEU|nr:hypothetical protein [Kutzneria kofuensis]MBB5894359.1 hypothetical protein [Kutzneria kofuensis]
MRQVLPGASAPVEIKIASLVLAGGGLVFLLTFLVLGIQVGDLGSIILPAPVAVISLGLGAGLLGGVRPVRIPALLWTILVAVLYASFALLAVDVWIAVLSGVLAAATVYSLVMQITLPARRHMGSTT